MVEIKREGDLATIVTGARIDTINAGEFEIGRASCRERV